mmetsp:Transcript_5618/g.10541  ORF Transcript_5618/g.10541 Transcript_5618/m.10541 type:complete len:82 (+) Transcript_5618:139-384(+)
MTCQPPRTRPTSRCTVNIRIEELAPSDNELNCNEAAALSLFYHWGVFLQGGGGKTRERNHEKKTGGSQKASESESDPCRVV